VTASRVSHSASEANPLFPGHALRERNEQLLVGIVLDEELDEQSLTHR
jgi:hypothetical protein